MDTKLKTYKLDLTFDNVNNLYDYIINNITIIEEKIKIKICDEKLLRQAYCLTGKEQITEKNILIYASENTMPESFGELITLAAATDAEIVVFIVDKINPTILGPIKWIVNISNDDTEFILVEANFNI